MHTEKTKPGFDPRSPVESAWLVADSIDATGQQARAGKRIAPDVDGWPEARVKAHVLHGKAVLTKPKMTDDGEPILGLEKDEKKKK